MDRVWNVAQFMITVSVVKAAAHVILAVLHTTLMLGVVLCVLLVAHHATELNVFLVI